MHHVYVEGTIVGELRPAEDGQLEWNLLESLGCPAQLSLSERSASAVVGGALWMAQAQQVAQAAEHTMLLHVAPATLSCGLRPLAARLREAFNIRARCPHALDRGWAWSCPAVPCRSLVAAIAESSGHAAPIFVTGQLQRAYAWCRGRDENPVLQACA